MLRSLPPSERDFEIYGAVVVEGMSVKAATTEFSLPLTRIVQIRDQVAEWIGAHMPPVRKLTPAQRVALAADIAEKRLDHLYAEALEAWRESQGDQTMRRTGTHGEMLITRESPGDVRYLAIAARIAERGAKLARGEQAPPQAEAGCEEPDSEDDRVDAGSRPGESGTRGSRDPVAISTPPDDLHDSDFKLSAEIERRRQAFLLALANDNSPVQPPLTDANGMLLDEPEYEPRELRSRPISRQPLAAARRERALLP